MSDPKTATERIYLVDAHAYLHRAYHAMPPLTSPAGEPVGALLGFARMLLLLIKREKPDYLAVCFDAPGPTFRHKAFKDYKATRKPVEDDLKKQLGASLDMVRTMGISTAVAPGFEADDILATLARRGVSEGLRVVVVSGDKDALQLVDDSVQVLNESKGVVLDAEAVLEKFKVSPGQIVDYLAILGDSSDNVPGVSGIGPVGAAKLLGRFGTLDKLLEAAREGHPDIPEKAAKALVEGEKGVLFGRELLRLDEKAPVELKPRECRFELKPTEPLVELFRHLGFRSLLREIAPESVGEEPGPAAGTAGRGSAPALPAVFEPQPLAPAAFLKACKGAPAVSLSVHEAQQPDLLHSAEPLVALALPDGRCAAFADDDFSRNKEALAALLSSEKVRKLGHDLKACMGILRGSGLELGGMADDTLLAAYCVDPSRGKYPLEALLKEYAGIELPAGTSEEGSGRRAAALWPLMASLGRELSAKSLEKLYRETELPALEALADMEARGVALDVPYLKELSAEFEAGVRSLKSEIDRLAGEDLNVNSPKQLGAFFFERLKLPVVHKTRKGGASTDEEALKVLAASHPAPAKILEYRELSKLKSTYVDALLQKMDPATGRIHTRFNQAGTATGRLSSLEPNLQNIPVRTPLGRRIRKAFRAGEGRLLVAADYSQIDLRALAHLSGDPALCEAFRTGEDIHLKTASEVFGTPPAEVSAEMRRRAKAVNFGIVYGQSAYGLGEELGIPVREAEDYIRRYFARYKGVEEWIQETLRQARRDGFVRTLLGRVRPVPGINSRAFQERGASERVAVNTPIQGTSADIIKVAMINIHRKMRAGAHGGAYPVLQVHDELIFEAAEAAVQGFGPWVRAEMENAIPLKVPVVVDLKAGRDWLAMEALR